MIPHFAARFDSETLMQRPAWVEPGSKLDHVLGELRAQNDPYHGINVAPIWAVLTPAQRQDLCARGWIVTNDRKPSAVVLHIAQDVPPARRYFGMMARKRLKTV